MAKLSKPRLFLYLTPLLWGLFLLQACMDDDALWETDPVQNPPVSEGVFIINEGNFMYGNASISYYNPAEKQVFNDVFFNTNGLPLGDVAHMMAIKDGLGYIVINNSGRIYVIDIETFELKGKITGFTSPRHIHFISDQKAYVSDLYAKAIAIINPKAMEIIGSIDVNNHESDFYQHPTEQMVQVGQYVFTNSWSFDNSILVIDTETDQWVETIQVLKQPQSMVLDKNNQLWVLTDGGFPGSPYGHEEPGLLKINTTTRQVETVHRFPLESHPTSLAINKNRDTLFFINRHVYRHAIASEEPPETFIESPYPMGANSGFRSLAVDPASSELYLGDGIDWVQPGTVYRFSPQATPIDTFKVGIIPGNFAFQPN